MRDLVVSVKFSKMPAVVVWAARSPPSAVNARPPSCGHSSKRFLLALLEMLHVEIARRFEQPSWISAASARTNLRQLLAFGKIHTTRVRRFKA